MHLSAEEAAFGCAGPIWGFSAGGTGGLGCGGSWSYHSANSAAEPGGCSPSLLIWGPIPAFPLLAIPLMSQLQFLNLCSVCRVILRVCARVTAWDCSLACEKAGLSVPDGGGLCCRLPGAAPAAPPGQCCCSMSPLCFMYPSKKLWRAGWLGQQESLSSSRMDGGKAWLRGTKGLAGWRTGPSVACKPTI